MSGIDMSKFIEMSIEELTTPKAGRLVHAGAWWAVNDKGNVLFYKHYTSPQCNTNKEIVKRIRPECERQEWIEVSFVPHNCHDYA